MNWDYFGLGVFFIALFSVFFAYRKNLVFHKDFFPLFYFFMLRTELGIKQMKQLALKYKNFLYYSSYFIIAIALIGMVLVSFDILYTAFKILMGESSLSVGLVLPIDVKGVFYVPFAYWIISIIVILVVHEFSHGLLSYVHNIKVKNTGIALVGIILPFLPAAFVEPDEEKLKKSKKFKQLSVYAAGPFSNIVLGIILMLVFSFFTQPFVDNMYDFKGAKVVSLFDNDSPAKNVGISKDEIITQVNNEKISSIKDFSNVFSDKKPGDRVELITNNAIYQVSLAGEKTPVFGVFVEDNKFLKENANTIFNNVFIWFNFLIFWLALLNLGVGLFNLLPISPLDGGRMLNALLNSYLPEQNALKTQAVISSIFTISVLVSILSAFT